MMPTASTSFGSHVRSGDEILLPGDWVEVLPAWEVVATLDADQSLDGLPFMPEMLPYCGRRFRVALRAERTCVHPPEIPFRRLQNAVTLEGLRCDGSSHGGCQLGCMFFWNEAWLKRVSEGAPQEWPDQEATLPTLRAKKEPGSDVYFCQATELPRATRPGDAFWKPGQYLRFLKVRTFSISELVSMFARPGSRGLGRAIRRRIGDSSASVTPSPRTLGLQPGEWVEVRSRDEILATLDSKRMNRGLSFGGDMWELSGRRMQVLRRVDRVVFESTGKLRDVQDTVLLEGSICDRYLGCARGLPFLWREAWLKRVEPSQVAEFPASRRLHRYAEGAQPAGRGLELAVKRSIDVVGSATAMVVLSPVLAWTAVAVAAKQGLPILFRHERPGFKGRPFTMYKFRTMRSPRKGEIWYLTDDHRVTPLGRFLRSSSLDELPELWNVLRGDMSLVGPRPLLTEYLGTYTPEERRRHDMRPGFTGWAAVQGRHVLEFKERLKLDVWYVDHWNLWLDTRILVMTVIQVLRRADVSATQNLENVGFPLPGVGGRPLDTDES